MANGGVNPELAAVLRMHETRQKERAKRWAVVRWVTEVEYHESEEKARDVLARMPVSRRAGLVDRETGDTWTSKLSFPAVMAAIRKEKTAPEHFRRKGKLGPIKPKRKRRGPQKR